MKTTTKHLIYLTIALLVGITSTYAIGTLTPSGTAGDDTYYSTNDIYSKLVDFTDTPTATSSPFSVPGSVEASFRTLTEIYDLLLAEEDDLVAENIRYGVDLFGVEGTIVVGEGGLPVTGQTTSYTSGDDGDYQSGIASSYTDNGNETIIDNVTGLMWKKCSEGLSGSDCTTGSLSTMLWAAAISACEADTTGGHTDWRLPNVLELFSLVDHSKSNPTAAINATYFPNTSVAGYLTSNTHPSGGGTSAKSVDFANAVTGTLSKTMGLGRVRCVR